MNSFPDALEPEACAICGTALAGGLCPRCLMADAAQATQLAGTAAGGVLPTKEEVAAAFPQLEIIELIGAGGMGNVWRARQPTLDRFVALKLLPATITERDPAFAERFAREGQLLARLHHPNIVTVHDSGRAGDFFYLIMEFVDGVNLRQAMRASRFTAEQALAIVPKICDALQYAHEEGVLHRDIKPENILLDAKGRVKLVDFGIAKLMAQAEAAPAGGAVASPAGSLTLGGTALGTPQYMAPEQREQPADVDQRADIYSLGVVFYELLTGELPQGPFAPPSEKSGADPRLDGIVLQALEKQRERRQGSVEEFRTQVDTVMQGTGTVRAAAVVVRPRFSRLALLGFCGWVVAFVMIAIAEAGGRVAALHAGPDDVHVIRALLIVVVAGLPALAGMVLGWKAVAQIRRSKGEISGMALAVFDVLLLPLTVLDGLLAGLYKVFSGIFLDMYANPSALHDPPFFTRLANALQLHEDACITAWIAVALVLDLLIILAVWRAVKRPLEGEISLPQSLPWRIVRFGLGPLAILVLAGGLLFAGRAIFSLQVELPHPSAFGPEMERMLPEPKAGVACVLDFETGQLVVPPPELARKLELGIPDLGEDGVKWLQAAGGDAVINMPNQATLRLCEGVAVSLSKNQAAPLRWEEFTPADVVSAVGQAAWEKGQRFTKNGRPFYATPAVAPAALAFVTREGSLGVMQIQGITDDPPGLKIRYKLLRTPAAPPAGIVATLVTIGDLPVYAHCLGKAGQPQPGEKGGHVPVFFSIPGTLVQQVVTKLRAKQPLVVEAYDRDMGRKYGSGYLPSVADQIDASAGTLECTATVAVEGNAVLMPNTFVNVSVLLETRRGVTLLPARAVQRNGLGPYVFRILPDDTVTVRPVTMGAVEAGMVEITQGLSAADRVVLEGPESLAEGSHVRYPPPLAAGPGDGDKKAALATPIEQSRAEADRLEALFKAGLIGAMEVQIAKDKVDVLTAELTGGAVEVARARFKGAERQLELAAASFQAGLMSGAEYEKFKGGVSRAEAALRQAEAQSVPRRPAFGQVIERVLPSGEPCCQQYFQLHNGQYYTVGNGPGTSAVRTAQDWSRIEADGGIDFSAMSSDQGIQLVGEGCIFTQDLHGLKWDSTTAEEVINTMKHASYTFGVMEPKMKDFPITYLFKTSRGEVGIMEVMGVVDVERDGGRTKGTKFRYKLVQRSDADTAAMAGNDKAAAIRPAADDSISLEQAVNDFNKRYQHEAAAAGQPPLTVEAVLAAIRQAMQDRPKLSVTNETFATLGRIVESRVLPRNFELELLTSYEPDDQATFDVWSVRLRIPGTVIPGGTTCIMIHELRLGTHVIGEQERKVIHAWQEKERAQGGVILGPETQKYRQEREAAAVVDARNRGPATPVAVFQMRWVDAAPSAHSEPMALVHEGNNPPATETLQIDKTVLLDQTDLQSASLISDAQTGAPRISVTFSETGKRRFAEVTRGGAGRRLAMVIGGQLWAAPSIQSEIWGGTAEISGSFTEEQARELVARIRRALPKQ